MNSTQLKRLFSKNYQAFFNMYDLVISTPVLGRYPGTGLFKTENSYIASEKYPFRNYIGVTLAATPSDQLTLFSHDSQGNLVLEPVSKYYPLSHSLLGQIGLPGHVGYFSEHNSLDAPSIISATIIASMLLGEKLQPQDFASLHVDNPAHVPILESIVTHDQELLRNCGFFSKRRNNSGFIGACILAADSHMLGTSETEFRSMGKWYCFEEADYSTFLLNPHSFYRPFFQSNSLFEHEKRLSEYAYIFNIPHTNISYAQAIESIGNAYTLEMYAGLKSAYDQKSPEDFFQAARLFWRFKHGIFADSIDREIDANRVWKVIESSLPRDAAGCAVQMGTRIQVFWDRGFDITDSTLSALSEAFDTPFSMEYSSQKDGFEHEGVKLEQWCSRGIYSEFIAENEIIAIKNQKELRIPIENLELLKEFQDGILIDSLEERIVIKGIPTTSQALKSQITTIDLLSRLLRSANKEAYSWELPVSSYAKNRSEMSSKIIGPLQRLVQEKFGTYMNIAIRNDDRGFIVTFDGSCSIPIYLLHKRGV